ncbi:hypothetical protein ACA910_022100 [Epithemia clementina (nom. ined.)]
MAVGSTEILLRLVMLVFYVVGILWHTLHPMASILSGRFQGPLTPFIDENSIEPTMFRSPSFPIHTINNNNNYNRQAQSIGSGSTSTPAAHRSYTLCEALQQQQQQQQKQQTNGPSPDIPCFTMANNDDEDFGLDAPQSKFKTTIQVAQIVPIQVPVVPLNEALVLIAPVAHHGLDLVVEFLEHLAQQVWLAKTIYVVAPINNSNERRKNGGSHFQPNDNNVVMTQTVDTFLDLYLGNNNRDGRYPQIPGDFAGAIVRQLMVLDLIPAVASSSTSARVIVSPWGRRGIMPNMDLYSAVWQSVGHVLDRSLLQTYPYKGNRRPKSADESSFWICTFDQYFNDWKAWVSVQFQGSPWLQEWWEKWWEFAAWEWAVVTQSIPIPPHASALDRGIDSLTIQAVVSPNLLLVRMPAPDSDKDVSVVPPVTDVLLLRSLLGSLELAIHSLSNAHERLHHNTALYTLPRRDGNAYVKHEEFLIPAFLLLVPLIVRAVWLIVGTKQQSFPAGKGSMSDKDGEHDDPGHVMSFDFGAALMAIQCTLGGTLVAALLIFAVEEFCGGEWLWCNDGESCHLNHMVVNACRVAVAIVYATIYWNRLGAWKPASATAVSEEGSSSSSLCDGSDNKNRDANLNQQPQQQQQRSIQFIACLLALYIHIPIAFGYVALAFPSAVLWTPLIAFPSFSQRRQKRNIVWTMLSWMSTLLILMATSPFVSVVPLIFSTFTTYVKFVYIPLHLMLSILWLSSPSP